MQTRAATAPTRPTQPSMHETNDHMTSTTNNEPITRHDTTRSTKTKQNPHDESNEFTARRQQQKSHPAWNQHSPAAGGRS